jgi:hypothetical protein
VEEIYLNPESIIESIDQHQGQQDYAAVEQPQDVGQ